VQVASGKQKKISADHPLPCVDMHVTAEDKVGQKSGVEPPTTITVVVGGTVTSTH